LEETLMSALELNELSKAWPSLFRAVRVPRTEADYRALVDLPDHLAHEAGQDEQHPLASLIDVIGVLIEKYENERVPELAE
jgi:HTH-type transcriptional regulator/antitoxin HigA